MARPFTLLYISLLLGLVSHTQAQVLPAISSVNDLIEKHEYEAAIRLAAQILGGTEDWDTEYGNALEALSRIDKKIATPMILNILKQDSSWEMRYGAAAALFVVCDRQSVPDVISVIREEKSFDVIDRASNVIITYAGRTSIPALLELAADTAATEDARFKAIWWLGDLGDRTVVPQLIDLAEKTSNAQLLFAIAQRLGNLGDERGLSFIFKYLKNYPGAWQVVWALENIRTPAVAETLVKLLITSSYPDVRQQAAKALATVGNESTIPNLKQALRDEDKWVCSYAAQSLWRLGDNSGLQSIVENDLVECGWLIEETQEKSLLPALLKKLKDTNTEIRITAALAIGYINNQEAIPPLWKIVNDQTEDGQVRAASVVSLIKLRDKNALPRLVPILPDADLGFYAAKALIDLPDPSIRQSLTDIQKDITDDVVLEYVHGYLAMLGDTAAIKSIMDMIFAKTGPCMYVLERVAPHLSLTLDQIVWIIANPYSYWDISELIGLLVKRIGYENIAKARETVLEQDFADYWKARTLLCLAAIGQENRDSEQQLSMSREALDIAEKTDDYGLMIECQWLIGDALMQTAKLDEAEKILVQALNHCVILTSYERLNIRTSFPEAYSAYLLGEFHLKKKNFKKSLACYDSAQVVFARTPIFIFDFYEYTKLKSCIASGIGVAHTELGKTSFQEAVNGFEKAGADNIRERESRNRAYLGLIRSAIADGNYEEAQELTEKLLLTKLNDDFSKMDVTPMNPERREEMAELKQRKQEIAAMKRLTTEEADKDKSATANQVQVEKQREFKKYINTLKTKNPKLFTIVNTEPADLKQLQDAGTIPDNTAILQYLLGEDELYIFVVTNHDLFIKKVAVGQPEIAGLIDEFRVMVCNYASPDEFEPVSNRLYDCLVRPLEPNLAGIEVLGIIPHQQLYYLPFAALKKAHTDTYLGDKYRFFYMNSTSLLGIVAQAEGTIIGNVPLVAFANADGTLPDAEQEVKNIARYYETVDSFYEEAALKEKVLKTSGNKILQLATHGKALPYQPNMSYLVLAPEGEAGKLTVEEIWGMDLKDCPLVVLSACETAGGKLIAGDEVVSLAFGFIYAGSASCLATLWSVASQSTAELMTEFHKQLCNGQSRAAALQAAQAKIKSQYPSPFYWAPFVLIGDWR